MNDGRDQAFLDEAVALAERGLCTTTPNPRVGCVIVRDGRVLGRGWHQWRGEAHAEVLAMQDAGGEVAGATVYTSLEPCCVQGETPPCADALTAAKVKRVVAGALDPDPRVNGGGLERLRAAGVRAELANHAGAERLNAPHRHRLQTGRPWVRIKLAASLDGRTAMASGASQWITGATARQDGQHWRARSCALITGIGTLLADDPRLNVRDSRFAVAGRLRQPLRLVVDSRLRTSAQANVFKAPGPVMIVHASGSDEAMKGAKALPGECVQCGNGAVDLAGLLDLLGARPCNEVLVEAGATLSGAFFAAGLWDELLLYLAPKFLGAAAKPLLGFDLQRLQDAVRAEITEVKALGPDLRIRLAKA